LPKTKTPASTILIFSAISLEMREMIRHNDHLGEFVFYSHDGNSIYRYSAHNLPCESL